MKDCLMQTPPRTLAPARCLCPFDRRPSSRRSLYAARPRGMAERHC